MNEVLITAVVATYNEEAHLENCLNGLLAQGGVPGQIEIIVVDGGSSDLTLSITERMRAKHDVVRTVSNPYRLQVYAWNIGIRAARGKYVGLISAHTEYGPDYFARCLEVMGRSGAANVAGVQHPVGDGRVGKVIAWAMQSRFGIGNAEFRYAPDERYVDHGFSFFFEKATAERIGGFDESFPVNEDCDFNYRLRKAGYRIFLSPAIEMRYHARSTLRSLARQMFRYGFWRRKTQMRHPEFVPLRVYAPPLLVATVIGSALAYPRHRSPIALMVPALYAAFLAAGAASATASLKRGYATVLGPAVLAVMHFSYGTGWLCGCVRHALVKDY